jgi:succinoglycan biosynthesis protein ExoA
MPCLDEERYIEACLRSILAQDYPADRLEVVIADGGSRDRTREIVGRIAGAEPRVKLVDNPARIQAAGMNQVIRRAQGDVVVRMDVHCEYAPDYVRRCVEALEQSGADNAGGAQRARAESPFQRALCAALDSPLGIGGARYRSAEAEGFVDTVFLGAFRRSVFERVGLYDPGAITNEDAELNQRIIQAGGKVFLSRKVVVHYAPRDSMWRLAVQYFRYGRGRARTILKLRRLLSIRPVLPFLMVVIGAVLLATPALHPAVPFAAGGYLLLTGVEAARVAWRLGPAGFLRAWAIFPVLHVSHAAGVAAGLVRYLRRPDWQEPERLPGRPQLGGSPDPGAGASSPAP